MARKPVKVLFCVAVALVWYLWVQFYGTNFSFTIYSEGPPEPPHTLSNLLDRSLYQHLQDRLWTEHNTVPSVSSCMFRAPDVQIPNKGVHLCVGH